MAVKPCQEDMAERAAPPKSRSRPCQITSRIRSISIPDFWISSTPMPKASFRYFLALMPASESWLSSSAESFPRVFIWPRALATRGMASSPNREATSTRVVILAMVGSRPMAVILTNESTAFWVLTGILRAQALISSKVSLPRPLVRALSLISICSKVAATPVR